MKTQTLYAPAYRNAQQVIECVSNLLSIDPKRCTAELKLVIGWNGQKFITSTDWHITYPGGKCILPPCVSPQYPVFIPVQVGNSYRKIDGCLSLEPGSIWKKHYWAALKFDALFPCTNFRKRKAFIERRFQEGERIILSDCEVSFKDGFPCEYIVHNDESTVYGQFVNGNLVLFP